MLASSSPFKVPLALGLALIASNGCNAIIGVEDLHEEARPGSGGSSALGGESSGGSTAGKPSANGGNPARGGTSSKAGGGPSSAGADDTAGGDPSLGGEAGAAASSGGTSGSSAGGAPSGGSPDVELGGAPNGEAGSGGTVGSTDESVRGTVIDFLGHRIPNAAVTIGDTTVLTDANGQFEFEFAPEHYDVSLVVNFTVNNAPGSAHWAYLGLSRRDPTLQVYRGLDNQDTNAHVTFSNGVFDSDHATAIAVGTQDGSSLMELSSAETTYLGGIKWYGPRTTQGKAHALLWSVDSSDLPVAYNGFAELTIAADSTGGQTELPITFGAQAPQSGSVSGTVTAPSTQDRRNRAFVRFTSNAVLPVVDDYAGPDTFSYLVPSLANSVITVAASTGDNRYGPFALAHKEAAPGQGDLALSVPLAPVLSQPTEGTQNVDTNTTFEWATNAQVSLLWIEDSDYYRYTYVLTESKRVNLPSFSGGSPLRSGGSHVWHVEVSGSWQNIDEATGPTGFQDAFAARTVEPVGSKRGDGSYAFSEGRAFKAK